MTPYGSLQTVSGRVYVLARLGGREPRNVVKPLAGRGTVHMPRPQSRRILSNLTSAWQQNEPQDQGTNGRMWTARPHVVAPQPDGPTMEEKPAQTVSHRTAGSAQAAKAPSSSRPTTSASRADSSKLTSREARE